MNSAPNVLVLSNPASPHVSVLRPLEASAHFTITKDPAAIAQAAPSADVILNGQFTGDLLRLAFPRAARVQWVHTVSAGVEPILFPQLIDSPVPLTNGRGVFARPLGEWAVAAMLFFAKDLRRLVRNQEKGRWQQFDIEELDGRTLGVLGYGEIGRAAAARAKPFGMRVIAIRRRPELSDGDSILDAAFPPSALHEFLGQSDYVVVAAPHTQETRGMMGEAEFEAMKPNAVIVNVGRGPVIAEDALIRALTDRRIRGAALDVFNEEPLPAGHPFWALSNVLISPHSADHTVGWLERAMNAFVRNFHHFIQGERLENVVDKHAGY